MCDLGFKLPEFVAIAVTFRTVFPEGDRALIAKTAL